MTFPHVLLLLVLVLVHNYVVVQCIKIQGKFNMSGSSSHQLQVMFVILFPPAENLQA